MSGTGSGAELIFHSIENITFSTRSVEAPTASLIHATCIKYTTHTMGIYTQRPINPQRRGVHIHYYMICIVICSKVVAASALYILQQQTPESDLLLRRANEAAQMGYNNDGK